jgi:GNAT superfamily N-acetyltransferase
MHYDATWHHSLTLRHGLKVELRLLRPEDKSALAEAFQRLSPTARFQRFHAWKDDLTPADLRYLTELDGVHHLAIVAFRPQDRQGVGVARFVELAPGLAEPALVVTDEAQGQGLGRLLLEHLMAAARERGIHRFRFEVLADNAPMLRMLHDLSPDVTELRDGPEVSLELPIDPHPTGVRKLLELAGRGLVLVLQGMHWNRAGTSVEPPR